jgi:diadenosine tetraphosphate (Ap4A) HIT family hydrolase
MSRPGQVVSKRFGKVTTIEAWSAMEIQERCAFCEQIQSGKALIAGDLAVVLPDGFPVSPGHTLIVPRRHVADYFALNHAEQVALWALVPQVKALIERAHAPDGYNIGMNLGKAAGQTVPHVHLHVIPRYVGDAADPRGGIRWILPARAAYWSQ